MCDRLSKQYNTTVVKKVIIYSDGCTYQNHIINAAILNAILHFCVKSELHVEQKILRMWSYTDGV